jgi:hypothetical protein
MRVIATAALVLTGCTTTFYGSPKVTNGVAGCRSTCDGWGMDLAGMVKMGDYSDGCICQVKPAPAPRAEASDGASGSVIPPATGVFLQMQAQANAAASSGAAAQQAASARRTQQEYGGGRRW